MSSKIAPSSSKLVKYQIIFLLTAVVVKILISTTEFLTGELRLEIFHQTCRYAWKSEPITESTFALHNYLMPIINTGFTILNIAILIYAFVLYFRKYLKSYALVGIILIGLCMIISYIISHLPANLVYNPDFWDREKSTILGGGNLYTELGQKIQYINSLLGFINVLGAIIILCATSLKKSLKWILSVGWIICLFVGFVLSYMIDMWYGLAISERYAYIYSHLYYMLLYTIALIILICAYFVNRHRDAKVKELSYY